MSVLAIIFAVVILSLFWGGFVFMLLYTLKLKGRQDQADDEGLEGEKVGRQMTDDR